MRRDISRRPILLPLVQFVPLPVLLLLTLLFLFLLVVSSDSEFSRKACILVNYGVAEPPFVCMVGALKTQASRPATLSGTPARDYRVLPPGPVFKLLWNSLEGKNREIVYSMV